MLSLSVMSWQTILKTNFHHWKELADFLELSEEQRSHIFVAKRFPLNLPRRLAQKMQKGTLDDPLLRQFLPTQAETIPTVGFGCDAVGDRASQLTPKLLKKYAGRALLVCTSACAMHCRFCFRQHYDYEVAGTGNFEAELAHIRADSSIHELILSGGDPLSLSNRTLANLLQELATMSHVRRIRWHTRFPIGIPERLDAEFCALLRAVPQQLWFIIHANHPAELDADVLHALAQLRQLGALLLNQAVLLKGVNDNIETLTALCELLVDHGISPYYLHQLDRVQGAAHFEVPIARGKELMGQLSARLPGYAVPRYVQEIAGEPHKTLL
jgi:EF-P beta-lysylation protein EpmB